MIDEKGIEGTARTSVGTDDKVRGFDVSASSDRGIIKKSEKILDIPSEVLEIEEGREVLNLNEI